MIWDRFDDAHDDLLHDIRDRKRHIRDLEARLEKAGISYKPYEEPASANKSGPQGWYEDTQSEESALAMYETYLKQLLEKGGQ